MKSVLKAPGTKRLKPKYDSNVDFKFTLRHYTKAPRSKSPRSQANLKEVAGSGQSHEKNDLRELARRQFPHASEQELDMLPRQRMFAREAVHSIVPDRLDEAMATLNKPPEATELLRFRHFSCMCFVFYFLRVDL